MSLSKIGTVASKVVKPYLDLLTNVGPREFVNKSDYVVPKPVETCQSTLNQYQLATYQSALDMFKSEKVFPEDTKMITQNGIKIEVNCLQDAMGVVLSSWNLDGNSNDDLRRASIERLWLASFISNKMLPGIAGNKIGIGFVGPPKTGSPDEHTGVCFLGHNLPQTGPRWSIRTMQSSQMDEAGFKAIEKLFPWTCSCAECNSLFYTSLYTEFHGLDPARIHSIVVDSLVIRKYASTPKDVAEMFNKRLAILAKGGIDPNSSPVVKMCDDCDESFLKAEGKKLVPEQVDGTRWPRLCGLEKSK